MRGWGVGCGGCAPPELMYFYPFLSEPWTQTAGFILPLSASALPLILA
jgi:hypothetical protein